MHKLTNLPFAMRRDAVAGAIGGLIGGLVSGWGLAAQDRMADAAGILGAGSTGAGLVLHLTVSVLLGAGFGAVFRYQAGAYAATITSGVLYALLWWIAGPLTLTPLLMGDSPTWSLVELGDAFPTLIGHLLYGGVTGLGFYALVTLYLRAHPEAEVQSVEAPAASRTRVVIIGGGFGGVSAAQRLEHRFERDPAIDITLVSQSNYLLFTPMLAEVASSGLEAQHISAPVRAALRRTDVRRAEVESIDTAARVVRLRTGAAHTTQELPYEHLVLAAGSVPNFHGLPGLAEHSFTLKTLQDATLLRNHVIGLLEQADVEPDAEQRRRLLTFVVAGGGFAGTEMIAELFDLVRGVLRYYPHVRADETRFVLVHSGTSILPELSAELGEYARRKLETRGVEFALGARVAGATHDAVKLTDGRELPTRTLVWTAGNQPHPLLATLPCERNRAGAVVCDATMRVQGLDNVWAVGDCAQVPDVYNEDKPCPPTAQHALRQGKAVGDNIAAALTGRPLEPFRFRTIGLLVALGRRTAAAEIRGRRFSGLLAWLMWRTVYLGKLPGLEKKVRVALDWTIDLFFPRDIVLTGAAPAPTLAELTGADGGPRAANGHATMGQRDGAAARRDES